MTYEKPRILEKPEKLLPCPFCGMTPTIHAYPYSDHIRCENHDCLVKPSIGIEHDFCVHDERIVDAWNRRAE